MVLEIIGFPRSNFVRTVRMVAQEKGVPYEHIPAMPHSDEVKAINPLGLIPVMRHDGAFLRETLHVLCLLLEKAQRNEEGEVGVLVSRFLEHPVEHALHLLPEAVPPRLDHHAPADG